MTDEVKTETVEEKREETAKPKDYGDRIAAIEKKQAEHSGVLSELKDLLCGFVGEYKADREKYSKPAEVKKPDSDVETRKPKPKGRTWF